MRLTSASCGSRSSPYLVNVYSKHVSVATWCSECSHGNQVLWSPPSGKGSKLGLAPQPVPAGSEFCRRTHQQPASCTGGYKLQQTSRIKRSKIECQKENNQPTNQRNGQRVWLDSSYTGKLKWLFNMWEDTQVHKKGCAVPSVGNISRD